MKKLLSIVLVFALVMAMGVTGMVTSSADELTKTTVITGASNAGTTNVTTWDNEAKEGQSAVFQSATSATTVAQFKDLSLSTAVDQNAYFWFYVPSLKGLNEVYWELSSGNDCKAGAVRYLVQLGKNGMSFQEGWNQVKFTIHNDTLVANPTVAGFNPGNDATSKGFSNKYLFYKNADMYGSTVDWTKINYFRVIISCGSSATPSSFKVNALTLNAGEFANDENTPDTSAKNQIFIDKDVEANRLLAADGATSPVWSDADVKVNGTEAFTFQHSSDKNSLIRYKNSDNSPFIEAKQDWEGYFWLYVENATSIPGYYWEIGSNGDCVGACVRYIATSAHGKMLQQGWNKITFKLHDSSALQSTFASEPARSFSEDYAYYLGGGMTGNVDWSKINFVRFSFDKGTAGTVKINGFTIYDPKNANNNNNNNNNNSGSTTTPTGDATPITSIALATLASALIAGVVFLAIKKRTER